MTEDELQELVETVAEAHAGLSEVAFKLRRELTPKGPALKAAIKAERETFRLKRALGRLDIEDAGESDRRGPATAAEGSTRRAVNTCPASGTNPQVFRVQPVKVRQGHEANL